jgi:hypothetical protein
MSNNLNDLRFELDERNLAHVLSAITLVAMVSRKETAGDDSTCWWGNGEFILRTAWSLEVVLKAADQFVRTIRWIPGFGSAEQGTFIAGNEIGSNPFISLPDNGQETSPFKTFSGQVNPARDLLDKQRDCLKGLQAFPSWMSQMSVGISSWGFDCRVGSHAYDLGFSSNDEGSGILDPIYTAVELMSIAAASFFVAIQTWQTDENTLAYSAWTHPIPLALVAYASGGMLEKLPARHYRSVNRGSAYGKGAAYRFFPEAEVKVEGPNEYE